MEEVVQRPCCDGKGCMRCAPAEFLVLVDLVIDHGLSGPRIGKFRSRLTAAGRTGGRQGLMREKEVIEAELTPA